MTSGADLFVVCKQCGSEVSPYVTECPYCGNRLRRRAPKLPRASAGGGMGAGGARGARGLGSRLGFSRRGAATRGSGLRVARSRAEPGRWAASHPYGTLAIVAASCVMWVVTRAEPVLYLHMPIIGSLHGDWWRLFTYPFYYFPSNGLFAFVVVGTTGVFGWLLERRHGPVVVLALFFGAGTAGALVACAVYPEPFIAGCNGGALALLAAWAAPDLIALRAEAYYEGDLLGAGAIAALVLVIPFALRLPQANWLTGVVGGALGLLLGLGLHRFAQAESHGDL